MKIINNFIPWEGCDDNTNKSSIHFLVVVSFHLELKTKIDITIKFKNPQSINMQLK